MGYFSNFHGTAHKQSITHRAKIRPIRSPTRQCYKYILIIYKNFVCHTALSFYSLLFLGVLVVPPMRDTAKLLLMLMLCSDLEALLTCQIRACLITSGVGPNMGQSITLSKPFLEDRLEHCFNCNFIDAHMYIYVSIYIYISNLSNSMILLNSFKNDKYFFQTNGQTPVTNIIYILAPFLKLSSFLNLIL
jgi:hypothetical protein